MRILKPQEFVNRVLMHAPKASCHVIKWQSHYPQMMVPEWREEVLGILSRNHKNKFSDFKFNGPDELDDDWQFVATPIPEAWTEIVGEEDHMVGQPLGARDYALIFGIVLFIAAVVCGIIVFIGLGGI